MDAKIYLNRVENGVVVKEEVKNYESFIQSNKVNRSVHQKGKYQIPLIGYKVSKSTIDGSINYSTPEASKIRMSEHGKRLAKNYSHLSFGRKTPLQKMLGISALQNPREGNGGEKYFSPKQVREIFFSEVINGNLIKSKIENFEKFAAKYNAVSPDSGFGHQTRFGLPRFEELVGPSKYADGSLNYSTKEARRLREYEKNRSYWSKTSQTKPNQPEVAFSSPDKSEKRTISLDLSPEYFKLIKIFSIANDMTDEETVEKAIDALSEKCNAANFFLKK